MIPSSPSEIYNKDLERLVETLQNKLEGSVIREEYLRSHIEDMKRYIYEVIITTSRHTRSTVAFFTSMNDAEYYIVGHMKEWSESNFSDAKYLWDRYSIHRSPNDVIASWTIQSVTIGSTLNTDGCRMIRKIYPAEKTLVKAT